jgi:hypothetical protein
LLSARTAELAAADYYTCLGHTVEDISITQLGNTNGQWKDCDLLIDGRPIDVKNARRSFSNPERYVEHCIPRFKQARGTNAEVSITGVLSHYQSVGRIAHFGTDHLILGEVRVSDIRRIYAWMRRRFGDLLKLDGAWRPEYHPGWMFEYPPNHYPDRVAGIRRIGDVLRQFAPAGVGATFIPGWLLALCQERDLIVLGDLPDVKRRVLEDLHSLDEDVGFSLPSIFLYVMGLILEAIANELPAECLEKYVIDLLFLRGPDNTASSPLGLEDPQGYVWELVRMLFRVQNEAISQRKRFVSFELTHPSILRGRLADGSSMTLLAYCGGWRVVPTRVKCGFAPLFFGNHKVCPSCGYLICDECGYCSHRCELVSSRQQKLAKQEDAYYVDQ